MNILDIKNPSELFPPDVEEAKKKYHTLAMKYHPDYSSDPMAKEIFQHINSLYELALKTIGTKDWDGKGSFYVYDQSKVEYKVSYYRKKSFELGNFYIGEDHVTFILEEKHKDLFNNGLKVMNSFQYKSDRMKQEIAKCLPKVLTSFYSDHGLFCKIEKPKDMVLLDDILAKLNGKLPIEHTLWIQSTIHNLLCYLEISKLVHHDISPVTYFVNPKDHSGALLGGWWYAKPLDTKISKINTRTLNLMPFRAKNNKTAIHKTDIELTKAVGREMLGDVSGKNLQHVKKLVVDYLNSLSGDSSIEEYAKWRHMLDKLGPRKFVKMDLTFDDIYGR